MAIYSLTAAEIKLVDAVRTAEVCDLTSASDRSVRPGTLRRLLFGLPVARGPRTPEEIVPLTAAGIHLIGAIIADDGAGELNLRNASGGDGNPLPPLMLERCVISVPIRLAGGRLRRLSLQGSKITHLDAPGMLVDGDLDISGLSSADPADKPTGCQGKGLCWIELHGARIDGSLLAADSQLATYPKRTKEERGPRPYRYALDLKTGYVRNRVVLTPNCKAYGGVRLSEVGADVCADGAHLAAEEDDAFDGEGSRIGGSLLLRALERKDADSKPFVAEGGIWLLGASIGSSFDMTGARLSSKLVATHIVVAHSVLLGIYDGELDGTAHTYPFTASGLTKFVNGHIGGDFDLSGARLAGGLDAEGLDVGGGAYIRGAKFNVPAGKTEQRFTASADVKLKGAKIARELVVTGAEVNGELDIQLAEIGGKLEIGPFGGLQTTVDKDARFAGIKVGRSLTIHATLGQDLCLDHAEIGDSLELNLVSQGQARHTIRLCSARTGELSDQDGIGVAAFDLNMEGFHYDRLAEFDPPVVTASKWRMRVLDLQTRLRRLGPQGRSRFAIPLLFLFAGVAIWGYSRPWAGAVLALWVISLILLIIRDHSFPRAATYRRLEWLARHPKVDTSGNPTYRPEPFERLTRYFRAQGLYDEARVIARNRLDIERRLKTFVLLRPYTWFYGRAFDYGMDPIRALIVFFVCVMTGWGGAYVADKGFNPASFPSPFNQAWLPRIAPVLVLDAEPVNPIASGDDAAFMRQEAARPLATELPCNDEIEPLIYALDVFVPALDLRQESRCTVTTHASAGLWRALLVIYSVLGWIVTSLTLLTITGILRRHAEA